ncbi:MAG TPA: glycosyltransferase family 39 protein [Patescibacteria group bacterium]|nr:glycosyltransferase family 39 protein [Patescibacteria group bacterium]
MKIHTAHGRYLILVIALWAFHVWMNYHVLTRSQISRFHDEGCRVVQGIKYYQLLFKNPGIGAMEKLDRVSTLTGQFHPPLFELAEAVSWKLLERVAPMDMDMMVMTVNAIFLLILLLGVYGIGSALYQPGVGLVSAVLVSFCMMVFGHTRLAMLDFPVACMVSCAVYTLVKTRGFQSRGYSILTGIVFATAVLTKETALAFFLPPFIYYILRSWVRNNKKQVFIHLIFTALCFIVIAGSLYLKPANLCVFKWYPLRTHYTKTSWDLLYYVRHFDAFVGPMLQVLFLPLLAAYLFNIKKRKKVFLFWLFVPLVIFSISPSKTLRLPLATVPALAIIVTQEIFQNNLFRRCRQACVFLLLSFAVLQYAFLNGGLLFAERYLGHLDYGILFVTRNHQDYSDKLVDIFTREAQGPAHIGKRILFIGSVGSLHWPLYEYALLHEWAFDFKFPAEGDAFDHAYFPRRWHEELTAAGYIIDKTGGIERSPYNGYVIEGLRKDFREHRGEFDLMATVPAGDGSNIYVYKRISN